MDMKCCRKLGPREKYIQPCAQLIKSIGSTAYYSLDHLNAESHLYYIHGTATLRYILGGVGGGKQEPFCLLECGGL